MKQGGNREKSPIFSFSTPPSGSLSTHSPLKKRRREAIAKGQQSTKPTRPLFPRRGVCLSTQHRMLSPAQALPAQLIREPQPRNQSGISCSVQHLAASNRHTDSQSVQHRLSPFISTTLCAKCSKRNSYCCPKQNIRIPTLCRQPSLEFQARAAHNAEGGFRHTTTA